MICNGCKIDKEANQVNFAFRSDAQCLRHTCRDCQTAQRKARFNKDKYGDDAYYRNLRKERMRARRSRRKKPEINRRATAKWREKNKEKVRGYARVAYYKRGKEYMRGWRTRNREWFNAYMRDWNRLNKLRQSNPDELVALIASALPAQLPSEIKDEVMQDLIVKVLNKEVRISQIKRNIKPLVTRFYRDYMNRRILSLDTPVNGFEDFTLGHSIEG